MLIDENLAPEWIFCDLDSLFRLKQSLAWELLLSALFTASDDSRSLFLDSINQALQSGDEILPVVLCNRATNLISSRMIGQLQVHVLQVVRLVFLIELFPQSDKQVVILNRICNSCQFLWNLSLVKQVGNLGPIILVLRTKGIG